MYIERAPGGSALGAWPIHSVSGPWSRMQKRWTRAKVYKCTSS